MSSKIKNLISLQDENFPQVLILSFSFMLIFTAFWTTSIIEQTVLNSVKFEYQQIGQNFTGDGYVALAIIYTVLAVLAWFAPSVVSLIRAKKSLLISAFFYVLFIASFLYLREWLLYLSSAALGAAAAVLWTAQGNLLSLNSNPQSISRNSGIFWAFNQCGFLFGNLFVYWQFSGSTIDAHTRLVVFSVLTGVCALGTFCLLFLKDVSLTTEDSHVKTQMDQDEDDKPVCIKAFAPAWPAFKEAMKLSVTPYMILLSLTSLYTGLEVSFYSGVYSTSVGNTITFGQDSKKLVGLIGILIGVGEVVGGSLFGLLGPLTTKKGKSPIIVLGIVTHLVSFLLIRLNLPSGSSLGATVETSYFDVPLVSVALLGALLLGFGDACFQTQLISIFASKYSTKSSSAFAIFRFVQSVGSAAAFFASSYIDLYSQLIVLITLGLLGSISFCIVEFRLKNQQDVE